MRKDINYNVLWEKINFYQSRQKVVKWHLEDFWKTIAFYIYRKCSKFQDCK